MTVVANALGFKTVIVIPETQSVEKKDALRLLGARLVEVPAAPYKDPNNYIRYSERLATLLNASGKSAVWANQFDNTANRQSHIETTAQEILAQTDGKVDGFVCAVGTGGTLAGVAIGLREKKPAVKIALADPPGASLYSYYTRGTLAAEGSSITKGIGQSRITANLEGFTPDASYLIHDAEALNTAFSLLRDEGLCVGTSSGVVAGAVRLARELGPGHVIVTILCDSGTRYQSKMFNPAFLKDRGLPAPEWLERQGDALPVAFV